MINHNNKMIVLIFFIVHLNILSAEQNIGLFEANVDWTCASDAIHVSVHTARPFRGVIHPSGFSVKKPSSFFPPSSASSSFCAIRGNGTLTTKLQIPLKPSSNSAWDECGIQMDTHTSTLWLLLEVHEHPLVMLNQDRIVNISCNGWFPTPIDSHRPFAAADQQQQNLFRLSIVSSSNGTSSTDPSAAVDMVFLGTEYNLSVQAVQPVPWPNIFVHSCFAISADKQTKVQLIDSDGCSMDQSLIADFDQQSNRLLLNTHSSTLFPLITAPNQKNPTQNLTTFNQKLPLVTVATAKIPQMFRFNTQFDQRRLNIGSVIHFECVVERCEERSGKTPTAIGPCPKTNCDRKRTIAERQQPQQQQQPLITTATSAASEDHLVDEHGGKMSADEELELVTQLLRAQQEEEEEAEENGGRGETDVGQPSEAGEKQQQNVTEMPDEVSEEDEDGAETAAKGRGTVVMNRTTVSGEVKQKQQPHHQQLQLVPRRQKQLQMVRNVVRVFETQRSVRDGTVPNVPKPSGRNGGAETELKAHQPTPAPQYADRTTLYHNPLFINDPMDFVSGSSTDSAIPMPKYNNSSSASSSPQQGPAAAPTPTVPVRPLSPPHHQCISMDQLSRLYLLLFAMCALFLFGCLFNLVMCCLGRKRTVAANGGGAALQMPFRAKRGRRQQPKVNAGGGHSSHTTLTSSLYGGGAGNEMKNGNAGKAQQQVGFWINEDGQRNGGGGGAIEYAPMVSSFYEGMPNVNDANGNANNGPQQRRLSVHSYASVKQRGNSQLLCKMPMPMNNGSSSMAATQQNHQHAHQQLSTSPSSYSPSTTASSSTSGGGGVGGPLLHENGAQQYQHHQQQMQQQQQYSQMMHNAANPTATTTTLMRSTFHQPTMVGGGDQQQQQAHSSVASSVRSSTTLDGGGPSCSQSTVGDESDNAVGGPTPRPSGIGDFGTVQHHPQYNYNNGNNGTTNMSSTFRCPTAESNAMLMMNSEHFNESFSIL